MAWSCNPIRFLADFLAKRVPGHSLIGAKLLQVALESRRLVRLISVNVTKPLADFALKCSWTKVWRSASSPQPTEAAALLGATSRIEGFAK